MYIYIYTMYIYICVYSMYMYVYVYYIYIYITCFRDASGSRFCPKSLPSFERPFGSPRPRGTVRLMAT